MESRLELRHQPLVANSFPGHFRPEVQDLDGTAQCPGLASGKPEDGEEEEEEELEEEDEDSLAGKSQDDNVSPAPEPQGTYEDEEDEEPPTTLAVGFDHTRRWVPASVGRAREEPGHQERNTPSQQRAAILPAGPPPPCRCFYHRGFCMWARVRPRPRGGGQGPATHNTHTCT